VPPSLSFTLHIGAALLMGMAIGLERQWHQRTAGLRTNALVALGAATFVGLVILVGKEASPTRVAAQVVSGIGFLGAGVIMREGLNVRGMNTAATLWCSAAVGTLAGSGFLLEGAIATGAVLLLHLAGRPIVRLMDVRLPPPTEVETHYRLRITTKQPGQEAVLRSILLRHVNSLPRMTLQGLATQDAEGGGTMVVANIQANERNDRALEEVVARVCIEPGVTAVSWQRTNP
jgi:putative Mg2+ transporter-C (MgtC) family protein